MLRFTTVGGASSVLLLGTPHVSRDFIVAKKLDVTCGGGGLRRCCLDVSRDVSKRVVVTPKVEDLLEEVLRSQSGGDVDMGTS